jgi:hypothetical protein
VNRKRALKGLKLKITCNEWTTPSESGKQFLAAGY